MPKIGDTKLIKGELDLWGMWDGSFWRKIEWTADKKSWIINKEIFNIMVGRYES